MDGDEMTRIIWAKIRNEARALLPFPILLKEVCFKLSSLAYYAVSGYRHQVL